MGETIELRSGGFRARIATTGAAIQALTWRDDDLVWPYTGTPTAFQGQVLAPWPNRIGEGRYRFDGAEYRLDVNDPATGAAIHGLVHDRPWDPVRVTEDSVDLHLALPATPGYPFTLAIELTYRLGEDGLTVTTVARNTGDSPAPFGLGFHPYLALGEPVGGLAARDALTLSAPVDRYLPTDDRLLPVGDPLPVADTDLDFGPPGRGLGDTVLDTAFTIGGRDADGRAWTHVDGPRYRVSVWCDASFGYLQLFSSDTLGGADHRAHLAVEPMTCPPDAFVSGDGLIVLAPGADSRHVFGITAAPAA
ncbi:aldose 1-epimerase family protein [Nocardiopsis lambiniae]|uniref:Aldose 1-epimerase family protein n=1 Tax=Nocardiopsis lambiniae TaxID=3075539 RepID=A0ABU2M3Q8_9ACTN|nr:aldose 1-epimerase family protein [Nocardiopsis sp. DSM 44743]MDT0327274.1 aldose 1-epimerase family protein [Nocardiopsis sp. DSM 44743]